VKEVFVVLAVSCDEKIVVLLNDVFADDCTEGAAWNDRAISSVGFLNWLYGIGPESQDWSVCSALKDFVNFDGSIKSSELSEGRFLGMEEWENEGT
jgi:hypothetical protein